MGHQKSQTKMTMKTKKTFFIIAFLAIISACGILDNQNQVNKQSIKGVWEYIEDDALNDVSGMSFFTDSHFAFVVNYKADSGKEILAHSGTYILDDSVVVATVMNSHNPALIGQKLKWIHGTDGEFASYEVLDQNGNVVETGKVRRLE